jgi:hypothetical protein
MINSRYDRRLRDGSVGVFSALAAAAIALWGAAHAQNLPGARISAPAYGIPPAANTARALDAEPGAIEGDLPGLYAALGFAIARTDNVNRVPKSSPLYADDTLAAFTPRLGYQASLGRHQALIEYLGFGEKFQDFSSLDATDHRILGAVDLDFTEKLEGGVFAEYSDVNERRGTSGAPILQLEPNRVEITDYGADARYGTRAAGHMQIRFGARADRWRYQNNDQQFRDRDTASAFGEIHYNATARTSVFVLADYRDFDYTNPGTTLSNSEEVSIQAGAEWLATSKTRGRVSVGRRTKDFEDPSVEDLDTSTYLARIEWRPKSYTTVRLYASRRYEETSAVLGNSFVSTLWGVGANHAFTRRWIGDVYFNYINDDFDIGRKDDYGDFGVGVSYLFRRWLSFGARYGFIKRDSNVAINDYEENYFGLTMQLSYQQQR